MTCDNTIYTPPKKKEDIEVKTIVSEHSSLNLTIEIDGLEHEPKMFYLVHTMTLTLTKTSPNQQIASVFYDGSTLYYTAISLESGYKAYSRASTNEIQMTYEDGKLTLESNGSTGPGYFMMQDYKLLYI